MVVERAPWMELDDYVGAYEAARAADESADLRCFAPAPGEALFLPVLRELVRVDLEIGWEQGTPRSFDEYLRRVPELARDRESLQAIAFEEYRLRRQAGQAVAPSDYHRYGIDTDTWESGDSAPRPAHASDDLASAALEYRRLRRQDNNIDGTVDGCGNPTPLPHMALFRALHRSNPRGAERLARAATAWPKIGTTFAGFRLTAELGRGAFGRVYLAQQGDLADRPVAFKIACDFQGEPQRLARLQHTNIVPIYSVHHQSPFHALCMPYFGATTLADVVTDLGKRPQRPTSGRVFADIVERRGDALDARPTSESGETTLLAKVSQQGYCEAVLTLAVRLADGLAHAHERGIVHRDLKPANVLLADDGQPMLLDFNLAADVEDAAAAEAAQVGGTLPYMPPELLTALAGPPPKGGNVPGLDASGDLYALGVILWELLAFRHPFPFHKGHLKDVLPRMAADRRSPPDVRAVNPSVPRAVAAIVAKCLTPDPTLRYRSARQLQDDLQRQLDDRPLRHAPEPSLCERAGKLWRRHPRTILALAGAVPLLLVSAFATLKYREAIDERRLKDIAEARVTAERFGREAKAGWMLLGTRDLSESERVQALDAARRALSWFGMDDAQGTPARLTHLPDDEEAVVRREIGEMLLVCAKMSMKGGRGAVGADDPRLREALRWNELAERFLAEGTGRRTILLQRAALAHKTGEARRAGELFDEARKAVAGTPLDRYWDALLALDAGRLHVALGFADQALAADPQSAPLWALRGQCHAELGEHDRAAACWDTAIALFPNLYRSYYHRGVSRLKLKDPAGARADFDTALRLKPNFTVARMQRAVARAELRDFGGSIADLESARDAAGAPTQVYFMLARVRAQAGDPTGAERDRDEGLRHSPTDDFDWVVRGLARMADDPPAALADFDQALALNPRYAPALRNKAHVFAEVLNRPADAVAALDALLEHAPDSLADRAARGVVLARLGRDDAARADAAAVLAGKPTPLLTYQIAGVYALTSLRRPDDARESLRLLAAALQQGVGLDLVDRDRDLDAIRKRPEFRSLVTAARTLRGG